MSVAQSVPTTARRKSAIGKMHSGRLSERRNGLSWSVGSNVTTQTAMKIETSVVDHGNEAATRTAMTSAVFAQAAGSRQTDFPEAMGELTAPALIQQPRKRAAWPGTSKTVVRSGPASFGAAMHSIHKIRPEFCMHGQLCPSPARQGTSTSAREAV
jgi:hypothetical protein